MSFPPILPISVMHLVGKQTQSGYWGHIRDRDERRRTVDWLSAEIGHDCEFLEQVRVARSAAFVWMRHYSHEYR